MQKSSIKFTKFNLTMNKKNYTHYDQVWFISAMQDCFCIQYWIDAINLSHQQAKKIIVVSINAKKAFENWISIRDKNAQQTRCRRELLQVHIEHLQNTPTAYILNSEKLNTEIKNKAGMSMFTTPFQHCPGNHS